MDEEGFSLAVSGLQVYRQCVTWIQKEDGVDTGRETFLQNDFLPDKRQQYTYDITRGKPFTTHSFFTVIQKCHTKIPRHYIQLRNLSISEKSALA